MPRALVVLFHFRNRFIGRGRSDLKICLEPVVVYAWRVDVTAGLKSWLVDGGWWLI